MFEIYFYNRATVHGLVLRYARVRQCTEKSGGPSSLIPRGFHAFSTLPPCDEKRINSSQDLFLGAWTSRLPVRSLMKGLVLPPSDSPS